MATVPFDKRTIVPGLYLDAWSHAGDNGESVGSNPRLKTQSISLNQQYVVDGIGYTSDWFEMSIPAGTSVYAEFTVPIGVYMALDYRLVNTSTEYVIYKVFPQGTYTVGTDKTDTADNFVINRNLRQDGPSYTSLRRVNVTTPPAADAFIVHVPVFGSTQSGNRSSGDLAPDDTFLLLQGDQTFLLELDNKSGTDSSCQVVLNYGYIPETLIPSVGA